MTIDEFIAALVKRFPRSADEITAWAPDYRYALSGLSGPDLAESLRYTLNRWTKAWPPKPGEIAKRRISTATAGKHALTVSSHELFGRPMGNGRDQPDLTDREFREWQHENGQLFLARLPLWQKMRGRIGDDEAARILKAGHDEDEIYRLYDQWRHGEPLDPKRKAAPDMRAAAIVNATGAAMRMLDAATGDGP